ncbi:MAG: hypothetical protein KGR26_01480 [Cyanobacteria bacterium REEB65]|nr:hypothetical protein [Cyanobacteria bacterium REEB65]
MSNHQDASVESQYWKTWAVLGALMLLSIASYFTGIKSLAIFTSLVVALSCTFVATTVFMHLSVEPRFIAYLCIVAVAVMGLFFALVAPDVLEHTGTNWQNIAAQHEILQVQQAEQAHPDLY